MNTKPRIMKTNNLKSDSNATLSLCMIVKDEEKLLPTCLESIRNHVDEIIVVDTGSTDRTVEIATAYNARTYYHPWENSFSKARNFSLKYATCDWILILDADEEIDENDATRLKPLLRKSNADLIYLQVLDKTLEDKIVSISNSERLFRNHLGIQYEGIVHNSLKYNCSTEIANGIKIFHYGYNLDEEKMERKLVRTSTLLREQIKNDPLNPMPHHFLAIAFSSRNKYDECIDEALQAIKLFELKNINTNVMLLTCYTVSVAYYNKNDLVNAEDYALKAINLYSDYLDGYFILSSIYMRLKDYDKCVYVTNRYLDLVDRIKSNPVAVLQIPYNNIQNAWHALTRLTIVYFEQNRDSEGIQALKEAVNICDDKNDPYLSIGKYFIEQNNLKLAEKILNIGLKNYPQNKRILYYISELYEKYNLSDKALNYFRKILDIYPEEALAQYKIGLLNMKRGRYKDAINVFKSLCSSPKDHIGALYNLGVAYELISDIPHAKETYGRLLNIEPENTEVFVRLGSLFLSELDYTMAKDYFLKTIKRGKYLLEAHLAMSKIYISLNDLESCVKSCDEILKCLNLPRNLAINNLSDLSGLYVDIGKALLKSQREKLSGFSFEIAELLEPVALERNGSMQDVVTVDGFTE
ncbi:MAG: glycosyltransferase [Candidatus Brocadiaceae bacterium]|nr:glycosyltransferase [Candidatus Brocadiaceae bacterium]